ncbi:MAG: 4Fe-4S binding protein [Candidatus Thermoplasmatota archaeon]
MKELTVISGKGGTGKTSITAAFASLADNAVLADCDVDASDLHLVLRPDIRKTIGFRGLQLASIDSETCIECGKCVEYCRFDAINEKFSVNRDRCEGCGVCEYVCPADAVEMKDRNSGFVYISDIRFGPFVHALLKTAEEASGKLVTMARENAKQLAEDKNKDLIIIDGSPGIGCPVISAITGVDVVLIVTEPTISAVHDLERILQVAHHFDTPVMVCINKYDINMENTEKIENFCKKENIDLMGKIPYDDVVTDAMVKKKNVLEFKPDNVLSHEIVKMWDKIKNRMEK